MSLKSCFLLMLIYTTLSLNGISDITISGNPGDLVVNSAIAGALPDAAVDATTTYTCTVTGSGKKITGQLDINMTGPAILKVALSNGGTSTSQGAVTMDTVARNLVTGMSSDADGTFSITYTLEPNLAAPTSYSRTLTLTID